MAPAVSGAASAIHWRADIGLWWPDYDRDPERCHAAVVRWAPWMNMAIRAARRHAVCLQAGGHVGIWPLGLAKHFARVVSFEPDPALFQCLDRNTAHRLNIEVRPEALAAARGEALLELRETAGSARLSGEGTVTVATTTIDSLGFKHLDAILLDIEGGELAALEGGAGTIARLKPVIQVEELPAGRQALQGWFQRMGYSRADRCGRDVLYVP